MQTENNYIDLREYAIRNRKSYSVLKKYAPTDYPSYNNGKIDKNETYKPHYVKLKEYAKEVNRSEGLIRILLTKQHRNMKYYQHFIENSKKDVNGGWEIDHAEYYPNLDSRKPANQFSKITPGLDEESKLIATIYCQCCNITLEQYIKEIIAKSIDI